MSTLIEGGHQHEVDPLPPPPVIADPLPPPPTIAPEGYQAPYHPSLAPSAGSGYGGAPVSSSPAYSTSGFAGSGAPATAIGLQDTTYAWMLSIPEVASVLTSWKNQTFADQASSDEWLKSNIMRTNWYRSTSQSARDWTQLVDQDPMTAEEKIRQTSQQVRDIADQMGGAGILGADAINISRWIATQALQNGWSSDILKDRVADTLGGVANWHFGGQMGFYGQQFDTLAHQYAVPLSDATMNEWVKQAIHGTATADSFRAYVTQQAESLYPQLKAGLDQGQTVRQIFDPYAQVAAKDLEISPDQIDFTDPKWNKAINQIDPKTGARTTMSLSQWQTEVRTNPIYGYDQTLGAKAAAANLTTQLLQKFGEVR